jgi:hypothetical protein
MKLIDNTHSFSPVSVLFSMANLARTHYLAQVRVTIISIIESTRTIYHSIQMCLGSGMASQQQLVELRRGWVRVFVVQGNFRRREFINAYACVHTKVQSVSPGVCGYNRALLVSDVHVCIKYVPPKCRDV